MKLNDLNEYVARRCAEGYGDADVLFVQHPTESEVLPIELYAAANDKASVLFTAGKD